MLPDLSPHLHTAECNFLVQLMKQCWEDHSFKRYMGACNYWDEAVWQCTRKERIWRKNNNPTYSKRLVELKRLPEEYYTPALKKLKDQGILIIEDSAGCKI